LSNIGDAKGMLTVGEGALNSTMDILQTMKEKAVQAANDTMGSEERTAIKNQLDALTAEIGDTLAGAEFNGTKIFGGAKDGAGSPTNAGDLALNFQVGASAADTFGVDIGAANVATLGIGTDDFAGTVAGTLTVDTAANAQASITTIDTAIEAVNSS
ncbi:flagellin, partial [Rubrivirga litoralis]|nr:hypothetical protein [Rubrivirga sp. F394]